MEENYYAQNLNAHKLYHVYQTKYSRVKQYLKSEILFVQDQMKGSERVLELGAGYGRIMKELAPKCKSIVGVDISKDNIEFGKEYLKQETNARLIVMDANNPHFKETFDIVLCLQNGFCAMKVEPVQYIKKVMDLLSKGGRAFISGYSPRFWEHRLAWFQEQADKGLLGDIDAQKTKDGVIVCKDGFRAATHSPDDMDAIGRSSGYAYKVVEVDQSSIFLIVNKT